MKLKVLFFLIISSIAFTQNSNAMMPQQVFEQAQRIYEKTDPRALEMASRLYALVNHYRLSESEKDNLFEDLDKIVSQYEEKTLGRSCKNMCIGASLGIAAIVAGLTILGKI